MKEPYFRYKIKHKKNNKQKTVACEIKINESVSLLPTLKHMGHDWGNNATVYLFIILEKLYASLSEEFCLFVVPHFIGAS